MNIQDLEILEDDFDLFVALDDKNKIEFLFDAARDGIDVSVMKQIENNAFRVALKAAKDNFSEVLMNG
mgnify:CR=1 FL=1